MTNLGGHDLSSLLNAFNAAAAHTRPVCFIAYTIKGFGLPLAGHKDNHAGLMTAAQMEATRAAMGIRPGHEWESFEGLTTPVEELQQFLANVAFNAAGTRRSTADAVPVPPRLPAEVPRVTSTQFGFGKVLDEIARAGGQLADAIVTASPDVTVSTNLGPWVNRRGLFAREHLADTFREQRVPSAQKWGSLFRSVTAASLAGGVDRSDHLGDADETATVEEPVRRDEAGFNGAAQLPSGDAERSCCGVHVEQSLGVRRIGRPRFTHRRFSRRMVGSAGH